MQYCIVVACLFLSLFSTTNALQMLGPRKLFTTHELRSSGSSHHHSATSLYMARRSSGGGAGALPPSTGYDSCFYHYKRLFFELVKFNFISNSIRSDGNLQSWEIGPPPDLPSLLLNNRIIYVGMPLVPSVTELVIAQLLYLNYQNDKMITMYINSPGTNAPGGGVEHYLFNFEMYE